MDDIRVYARTEQDIDSLIHTTRICSNDIGKSLVLEKCCLSDKDREGSQSQTNGIHEEATSGRSGRRNTRSWKNTKLEERVCVIFTITNRLPKTFFLIFSFSQIKFHMAFIDLNWSFPQKNI